MGEQHRNPVSRAACSTARGRNAAVTRAAILDAARRCFASEGYEQVGVRDIAAIAGIDPSLVNRYFGSKERLFAEATSSGFICAGLLAGDRGALGQRIVRYVLERAARGRDHDPLVALLRSSGSDATGHLFREALRREFIRPLAARLDGDDAQERAELVAAILLGLLVYQLVVASAPAAEIDRQVALAAPIVQAAIDGSGMPRDTSSNAENGRLG
jgi:AcrR family transcriptional regulator